MSVSVKQSVACILGVHYFLLLLELVAQNVFRADGDDLCIRQLPWAQTSSRKNEVNGLLQFGPSMRMYTRIM